MEIRIGNCGCQTVSSGISLIYTTLYYCKIVNLSLRRCVNVLLGLIALKEKYAVFRVPASLLLVIMINTN